MQIEHEQDRRFFVRTPHGEAELSYAALPAKILDLKHTFVPGQARSEGVAGALVAHAFEYARANGYTVRPTCSFAREWVADHPEHQELVASSA